MFRPAAVAGKGKKESKVPKKPKSADIVTRDYTINMHKRLHGMCVGRRARARLCEWVGASRL